MLFGAVEVSENAELRNFFTKRLYKKHLNKKHGRYYLTVLINGKIYCKKVSRIVAEAFIPNPEKLSDVNHIDGDKTNDKVCNLEWVNRGDNIRHAFKIGLKKRAYSPIGYIPKKESYFISSTQVVQYDMKMNKIAEYKNLSHAARALKLNYGNMLNHLRGKKSRLSIGGFIFKWAA